MEAGGSGNAITFLCARVETHASSWKVPITAVREAVGQAQALVRDAVIMNDGLVVGTAGSSVSAAFNTPTDAFAATIDLLFVLAESAWGDAGQMRAACALHAVVPAPAFPGMDAVEGDGGQAGLAQTEQLLATIPAGQVVVTGAVADRVKSSLIGSMHLAPLRLGQRTADVGGLYQLQLPGFDGLVTEPLASELPLASASATSDAVGRLRTSFEMPARRTVDVEAGAPGAAGTMPAPAIVATPVGPPAAAVAVAGPARLRADGVTQSPAVTRARARVLARMDWRVRRTAGAALFAVIVAAGIPGWRSALETAPFGALGQPLPGHAHAVYAATISGMRGAIVLPPTAGDATGESAAADIAQAPGDGDAVNAPDTAAAAETAPPAGATPTIMATLIRTVAARQGLDSDRLLRIASCESELNPEAVNAHDGSLGLFQFQPTTWTEAAPKAGYDGVSPFDPIANVEVAAYLMARGEYWRWTCQ